MVSVLGFLVFFYCYYCNAELLEEGTTVTTTIEGDFTVEETTTIENKSTGDVLDSNTGIVGETYEGDFDKDWGGQGPIQGMLDCTQYFDSGTCGVATGTSLTTFQQTINLDDFYIEDGGKIDWSLDFYAPLDNVNAYTEAKGYLDGVLQWESGQNSLTYTANPSNYTGSYNFDGGLDRLFIAIGGYNTYYVDNASLTIQYNVITTVINQYLNIIEPTITQNELVAIAPVNTYNSIDTNSSNSTDQSTDVVEDFSTLQPLEDFSTDETTDNITITTDLNFDDDITTTNTLPDISSPSTILVDPEPTVDEVMEEFNLDIEVADATSNNIVEPEIITEIENTETTTTTVDNNDSTEINEMESTDVQTLEEEGSTTEIAKTNTTDTTESTEANSEEESTEGSESSENTLVANDNNNENETEKTEKQTEENIEEVKNEEESQAEEKEIATNETEEKQESKKEDKEEKEPEEVAEKEPKKEIQSTEKQTKEEKKQEQKQKKANAIIANITSQYDGLAQVTMLALVNALGADYNSYRQQQQITNTVLDWYEPKEIYADNFIPDPLGDYIKVRSSIMLEKMIEMQYDK